MPKKMGDSTPTQITIRLLVFLLENDRFHTLSELAERFEVSKQTVLRCVERPDLAFFGRLIKEKQGKEVAWRLDKSKLLSRLMRAGARPERPGNAEAVKSGRNAHTIKGSGRRELARERRSHVVSLEEMQKGLPTENLEPLVLAVLARLGRGGR